ncbi:hypothetical protein ABPG72_015623 [Tetrahymena utriculariae]
MKRKSDMVNELSDDEEKICQMVAEYERQEQQAQKKPLKGQFYLQKMMKKNDNSEGQRKINEMPPVQNQMIMRGASMNHKRFQIIEFQDALVLKILINQNSEMLRKFCSQKNMNFRIRRDKKPAYIEVFGNNQQDMDERDLQEFTNLVMSCKVSIRNEIKEIELKCNSDEYAYINKKLDDYIEQLNYTEVKFLDPEGNQDEINPEIVYNPDLIRSYLINQKFILKLSKIEKPQLLGFQNIDLFLINLESDGIYTDSFGYELINKNKQIKDLIKKNKDKLTQEDMIYDQIFKYDNKEVNLCIQTSKSQEKCIENLKNLFIKIDQQELYNKGFLNICISLNLNCGKKYMQEILKYLNKVSDEDTYLSFPSEINLFMSEERESTISSYLSDVIKNKNINPDKVKKGGQWSYAVCYYGQNRNQNYFFNFNANQYQNLPTTNFKENPQIAIERAFLREEKKVYIASEKLVQNPNQGPFGFGGYYKKGKKVNKNNEAEDDMVEDVEVNFDNMTETFLSSKLERPISQDPKKKQKWQYIDTITEEFADFEEELCKVFKSCQENGQKTFIYQRNIIDFSLSSHIMKCDISQSMMTDLKTGDIFFIKREENSKYNYLVEEADPSAQSERIDVQEQKKQVNKKYRAKEKQEQQELEEKKKLGPQLKIRGLKDGLEIAKNICEKMKKEKRSIHTIKLERKIPKNNLKFLEEISLQNNIEMEYDEKREELILKGYKKTINRLRNQFIKGLSIKFDNFTVPDDWESQDKDVEVYDVNLDSEFAKNIIKLVKKSIPNAKFHKLERIQNLKLWKNFCFERKKLEEKGDATEKWLFHGTRNTDPSVIYKGSEEGFDFRVCQGGMYGRGTYFHDMASYSYGFGHNKGGKIQLFCAKVLIGKCYATGPNGNLTAPPFIAGSKSIRYDSIRSNNAIGQNEYVIFNNSKAYPYYLITITNQGGLGNNLLFNNINNNNYYSDEEEEEDPDFYDEEEDDY